MSEEQPSTETKIVPAESGHISLRVLSSNGNEMFFKIRKNTRFTKLMAVYCQKIGATSPDSIKFLFEGMRLNPDSTPEMLEMEDNDVIDAVPQQTGGSK